jgi:hypothetical protein
MYVSCGLYVVCPMQSIAPFVIPLALLSTNDKGATHVKYTTIFALPMALTAAVGLGATAVLAGFVKGYHGHFYSPYVRSHASRSPCSLLAGMCTRLNASFAPLLQPCGRPGARQPTMADIFRRGQV